ncbi:MAG: sulfite exporter TauE/SafE family protein [Peptococcaceae bacterium]|nr:sulfite exporter TauE/SafE family protein [Peptococcaceae bacterium]
MVLKDSIFLFSIGLSGSFIGSLAGGGGLITLPAMMLFGIPVQFGIGANKFSFLCASITNTIQILKEKRIPKKILFSGTVLGAAGGFTGGLVTSNIEEKILNIAVLFLLSFALVMTVIKKPKEQEDENSPPEKSTLKQKILTFFIGVYDGGFGPGSATLGIMMFMHRGYQYIQSVHLTRMLVMGSCTGAMIVFLENGFINWNYVIPLTMGSIIGAQIGFQILPKISQKTAKTLLMIITVLLIVQIFLKIMPK